MSKSRIKELPQDQREDLLAIFKARFEENMHRHQELSWSVIQAKLEQHPRKLWSLNEMEKTGGEPDVIGYDDQKDEYLFCDCVKESPKGRRSLCYDREALESRKKHKPENSVMDLIDSMGIELLSEEHYRLLQSVETVDMKTSSWILTPDNIRKLGGALFCDYRYGHVFVYHNGADSYYAARGFRGMLRV
ncbi:hypothetical protein Q73_08705 [Bacillus coahuilensis m2-6]|uniref:DUF4256 domain-containing protein n=1 Tax=Bacillus coahuilensis TaxID=408580 RepID=UPI0007506319|nr:DUF4256 domain-containing protein [Bacillus coahuilensis]KUP07453.1 hypothetical protein Q73_08705 [Bacillus coahuilensis m2-6]